MELGRGAARPGPGGGRSRAGALEVAAESGALRSSASAWTRASPCLRSTASSSSARRSSARSRRRRSRRASSRLRQTTKRRRVSPSPTHICLTRPSSTLGSGPGARARRGSRSPGAALAEDVVAAGALRVGAVLLGGEARVADPHDAVQPPFLDRADDQRVGGVAGEDEAAHRDPVLPDRHLDHDLGQVGAVSLELPKRRKPSSRLGGNRSSWSRSQGGSSGLPRTSPLGNERIVVTRSDEKAVSQRGLMRQPRRIAIARLKKWHVTARTSSSVHADSARARSCWASASGRCRPPQSAPDPRRPARMPVAAMRSSQLAHAGLRVRPDLSSRVGPRAVIL